MKVKWRIGALVGLTAAVLAVVPALVGRAWHGEETAKVIPAPDHSFQVSITETRQHFPYGVEGNIFVADPAGAPKRWITDYFVDFLDDVDGELRWDSQAKGFWYSGKAGRKVLVGPKGAKQVPET